MEFIVELFVVYILSFPGAFIRWGINGFKKGGLSIYLKKDIFQNYLILIILLGIIFAITQLVMSSS